MKRPFTPSFIDKLDEDLLLHRPDTWSTRIHLVLYYGLMFILLLAGICFIVPYDPGSGGQTGLWTTLLSIIAVIGFIFWLIYLLRFNVFKRYGNLKPGDGIKTFVLFFVCVGTLVILPYVPPYVESVRANNKFGNDEIVNDLNAINTRLIQLEYDSLDLTWDNDSVRVVNSYSNRVIDYNNNVATIAGSRYEVIDTGALRLRLLETDSVVKINDSFYVFYTCPVYTIIDPIDADQYSSADFLHSTDLYYGLLKNFKRPNAAELRKELFTLLDKYDPNRRVYNYDYYENNVSHVYKIRRNYNLYHTEGRFNRIIEAKYRWKEDEFSQIIWRVFFYITLGLTLLVFIYRHTTIRTFFLSLLSVFVITLLSSIILAIAFRSVGDPFLLILIYYVLFGLIALVGLRSRTRNVIAGIALNIFVFCTPFIPLVATAYYYWQLRFSYRYDSSHPGYDPTLFDNETIHYFYAELGGIPFFLLLIDLAFRKLYRNWYAKPEQ